jgi:nitrous oxidase accessory protein NosD
MKDSLALLAILALCSCGGSSYPGSSGYQSLLMPSSLSSTEVLQCAVDNTPAGESLMMGNGNFFIDSTIVITKPITILGFGTTITASDHRNILSFENSGNARVFGVSFVGSNQSNGSGDGLAIQFSPDANATSPSSVTIQNCYFQNFKGDYWVDIRNRSLMHEIDGIDISHCRFVSMPGNSRDGTNMGVPTAAINITGTTTGAVCRNISIGNNSFTWRYSKQCVALWAGCRNASVRANSMSDVGTDASITDNAGAYAFMCYDSTFLNAPRDIVFSDNVISCVRSCGVYLAGATNFHVIGNRITGQTDTVSGSMPKGAVIMNGCSNGVVSGNNIDSIAADGVYTINDPSYQVRNISILGNTITNSRNGIVSIIAYSPDSALFIGGNVISAIAERGISAQSVYPGTISGLTITSNTVVGSLIGIDIWSGDGSNGFLSGVASSNASINCSVPLRTPTACPIVLSGNIP